MAALQNFPYCGELIEGHAVDTGHHMGSKRPVAGSRQGSYGCNHQQCDPPQDRQR